ncbi:hypothetical protein EDD86DRAFT_257308, partial [Gorgonomyces haynaldii]
MDDREDIDEQPPESKFKFQMDFFILFTVFGGLLTLGMILVKSSMPLGVGIDQIEVKRGTRASGVFAHDLVRNLTLHPHPSFSHDNLRVRSEIIGSLKSIQQEYSTWNCTQPNPFILRTEDPINLVIKAKNITHLFESTNVIVQVVGKKNESLLVSAHYDSTTLAPGVTDDGIGIASMVAVLRTLAFRTCHQQLESSLVFNFNNGEELYLLGADAFIHDPLFQNVKAFVNLEGTGTAAEERPMLFRANDMKLVSRILKRSTRPHANVIFNNLVKFVASDTDYRPYVTQGRLPGADIAYYSNRYLYHTDGDNIDHASLSSVQYMADNLLDSIDALQVLDFEKTREIVNDDLGLPEFTYYDVFGVFTFVSSNRWYLASFCILIGSVIVFCLLNIGQTMFKDGRIRRLAPTIEATANVVLILGLCLLASIVTGYMRSFVNPGYSYGLPEWNLLLLWLQMVTVSSLVLIMWKSLTVSFGVQRMGQYQLLPEEDVDQRQRSHEERKQEQMRLSRYLPFGINIILTLVAILAVYLFKDGINMMYLSFVHLFYSLVSLVVGWLLESLFRSWIKVDLDQETEHSVWMDYYQEYFWVLQLLIASFVPFLMTFDLIHTLLISLPSLVSEGVQSWWIDFVFSVMVSLLMIPFVPGLARTMPRFFSAIFGLFWTILYLHSLFVQPFSSLRPIKFDYLEQHTLGSHNATITLTSTFSPQQLIQSIDW